MNIKRLLLLFCLLLFILPLAVYADTGPKPMLTVTVKNAPEGPYLLDLLVDESYGPLGEYQGALDAQLQPMLRVLQDYDVGGWQGVLAHGGLTFGELEKGREEDVRVFTYMVPERYKIIMVTPDLQVKVSAEVERQLYVEQVTFDAATGEVGRMPAFFRYLLQFIATFISTVIIEGLILLLFGFSLKENLKVFLLTNALTQLVLTLTIGSIPLSGGSLTMALFRIPLDFILLEVLIAVFEAQVYKRKLKLRGGKSPKTYAYVANACSCVYGVLRIYADFAGR